LRRATVAWVIVLSVVGDAATSPSSAQNFPELRNMAASLPGDAWSHSRAVEIGYAKPFPLRELDAGWLALRSKGLGAWSLVGQLESLHTDLVRDSRWGVGIEGRGQNSQLTLLALSRRVDVASLSSSAQRSLRVALQWSEAPWTIGGRWELAETGQRSPGAQALFGLESKGWRFRVMRRPSPYGQSAIWEGGFELRDLGAARLGLRLREEGAVLSLGTIRGEWSYRLATTLDGVRAGALAFTLGWR
jgi:hypothetical protein